MISAIKGSKKCFFKYISNKRRGKNNLHPLLHMGRNIVTKEKTDEVLNALFVFVFNSNTSFSLDTWPAELEDRDREKNEVPLIQGDIVNYLLPHKFMGLNEGYL